MYSDGQLHTNIPSVSSVQVAPFRHVTDAQLSIAVKGKVVINLICTREWDCDMA